MKNYAIATSAGVMTAAFEDSEMDANTVGSITVMELKGKTSTLALRYKLVDGKIVDQFVGVSDSDVIKAVETARDAAQAEVDSKFTISSNDFLRFLGATRRVAIRRLAAGGDQVAEDFLDMFNRVTTVDSKDADLAAALKYLEGVDGKTFGGLTDEFFTTGRNFVS